MTKEKIEKSNTETKPKKPKHRSPNFPSLTLEKSIEKAKEIYEPFKNTWVPERAAHESWGYASFGSQGLLCTAALKAFGLIQVEGSTKNRKIAISDAGRRILLNADNYEDLINIAALSPPLHKELWEHYDGFIPTSDEVFRKYLLIEKNFNEKSVDGFIVQFRATIALTTLGQGDILKVDENRGGKKDESKHQSPPKKDPNIQRTKVEELSHKADLRELKIFLPSGDAYLFVPLDMEEDDFEILSTLIEAHKKATNRAKERRNKLTDSGDE